GGNVHSAFGADFGADPVLCGDGLAFLATVGIQVFQLRQSIGGDGHLLHGSVGIIIQRVHADIAAVGGGDAFLAGDVPIVINRVGICVIRKKRMMVVVVGIIGWVGQDSPLENETVGGVGTRFVLNGETGRGRGGIGKIVCAVALMHVGSLKKILCPRGR